MKKFMKFRHVVAEDTDPGEWMVLREVPGQNLPVWRVFDGDPEKAEEALLKVRTVPEGKLKEIKFHHRVKDDGGTWTREGFKPGADSEKDKKVNLDTALFALIDTRLFVIEIRTPITAQKYADLLGHEVKPPADLSFDKQWDKSGLKEFVLADLPPLANQVCFAAAALKARDQEEEAGKA